jgi:hypothetical protein
LIITSSQKISKCSYECSLAEKVGVGRVPEPSHEDVRNAQQMIHIA